MDQSLNSCLEDINNAVELLTNQNFKPPGIFHNAIVNQMVTDKVSDFAKILRDTKEQESSMFKIEKKVLKRKDSKQGIFDFLSERNLRLKRNRNIGLPDPKPIVQIPKKFYLEQQEGEISVDNKWNTITGMMSSDLTKQLNQLLSKFKNNPEARDILVALQTGSVIIDEDESVDAIFAVLHEIDNLWPLSEFSREQEALQLEFKNLKSTIETLQSHIRVQETEIEEQYAIFTNELIARKQNELDRLENDIRQKKRESLKK